MNGLFYFIRRLLSLLQLCWSDIRCHLLSFSVLQIMVCVVVQSLSCVQLFATPWTAALQTFLSFTLSQSLVNSCSLSWWCYPTISSASLFSVCLQSFPVSESFPVNWLFASSNKSVGASALISVLSVSIQGWFPLGLTGLISLLLRGL